MNINVFGGKNKKIGLNHFMQTETHPKEFYVEEYGSSNLDFIIIV